MEGGRLQCTQLPCLLWQCYPARNAAPLPCSIVQLAALMHFFTACCAREGHGQGGEEGPSVHGTSTAAAAAHGLAQLLTGRNVMGSDCDSS